MKTRGFTLIELLAVIVILAIIALIAVPTILNIINDTRIESKKRSIDLYGRAIELAIARKNLTSDVPIGNYKIDGNKLTLEDSDFSFEVEYDGSKVECDIVQLNEDGMVYLDECKVDGDKVDYSYGDKYTKVEYLESTGTQYINTNFIVNIDNCSNIRFVVDTKILSTGGWLLDGSAVRGRNGIYIGARGDVVYYGVGNDVSTNIIHNNKRYVFDLDVKNNKYIVTDKLTGEKLVNLDTLNTNLLNFDNVGLPLWLFGYSGEARRHNALIYSCKIYDNDILVRDFIPVLDEDGTPSMYDKVEKKYYYNQGIEEFKYGY